MCASCLVQSLCTAVHPPCSKWSCSGCSLKNTCNTVKRCEWHVLCKVGLCSYCTGSAEHTAKPQVPRAARKARGTDWRLKAGFGASGPGLVACPAPASHGAYTGGFPSCRCSARSPKGHLPQTAGWCKCAQGAAPQSCLCWLGIRCPSAAEPRGFVANRSPPRKRAQLAVPASIPSPQPTHDPHLSLGYTLFIALFFNIPIILWSARKSGAGFLHTSRFLLRSFNWVFQKLPPVSQHFSSAFPETPVTSLANSVWETNKQKVDSENYRVNNLHSWVGLFAFINMFRVWIGELFAG